MAPFNLQGLNVVRPVELEHDLNDHPAPAPDFSAHLDLWTNLAFESDEPLASSPNTQKRRLVHDDDDDDNNNNNNNDSPPSENAALSPSSDAPPLDIHALLAGFGIDPRLMPVAPPPPPPVPQSSPPAPSLAQLLALHAAYSASSAAPSPPPATPSVASPSNPPSKRSRSQKSSSSTDRTSDPRTPQSPDESSPLDPNAVVQIAAEDKRRRNTAASARFRLKKKEREAALERRAKELEERVVELERECEGLRRENGWLKGLVVGVTGAGVAQHQQPLAK